MSVGSYLSSILQNTLKTNQVEINTDNRTLKPVAKLKEPRDLFALPKELDCPQQAARWPAECQVRGITRCVLVVGRLIELYNYSHASLNNGDTF